MCFHKVPQSMQEGVTAPDPQALDDVNQSSGVSKFGTAVTIAIPET